jgi:hypothetical protein
MIRQRWQILGGILLIAAGALFLLDSLGFVTIGVLGWALLLAAAGLAFLYLFLADREQWWALIPGCALLSVAVLLALAQWLPDLEGGWLGAIVPAGISVSFWVIFFLQREFWWAAIPGGVLLTVALVAGLSSVIEGEAVGGVLFLGLGLTFGLLGVIPTPQGRMRWAFIPAAVMVIMGLIVVAATSSFFAFLWPAALILAGLYLLARILGSRRAS